MIVTSTNIKPDMIISFTDIQSDMIVVKQYLQVCEIFLLKDLNGSYDS